MTALVLVLALAFLVASLASVLETVLLCLPRAYIAELTERNPHAGSALSRLRQNLDEPLTVLLTLSTAAQTAGAAIGGALALQLWGSRGIAAFTVALTLGVLLLAELFPRAVGTRYWRSLAVPTAHTLRVLLVLTRPLLAPLARLRRWARPRGGPAPIASRAELEILAELGWREGSLDQEEWEVVTNVINLDQLTVSEVMTPRTSIVALPVEATVSQAKDLIVEQGHLRLPVYEGSIDRVVGVLLARDLWRADREGIAEIRQIMRPPTFVPGTKPVEDLIPEMRVQHLKLAIVVDEYGGTAGLVTLEDLIEQIVGEIQDEHEQEPLPFEEALGGEVRIRGDVPLWEVNERFELSLPEEVYDTVGGYVFGQLGRIAEVGDEVEGDGIRLRVVAMDGRRIERVALIPRPPP